MKLRGTGPTNSRVNRKPPKKKPQPVVHMKTGSETSLDMAIRSPVTPIMNSCRHTKKGMQGVRQAEADRECGWLLPSTGKERLETTPQPASPYTHRALLSPHSPPAMPPRSLPNTTRLLDVENSWSSVHSLTRMPATCSTAAHHETVCRCAEVGHRRSGGGRPSFFCRAL